jgi:hypothetical protein
VNRRVRRDGLQEAYGVDAELREGIRSLTALSLLPIPMVRHAFDLLHASAPQNAEVIYIYFRK